MSRPIRILVANGPETVNGVTWWRMYRPLHHLYNTYHDLEITYNTTGQLQPHHFIHTDVVIVWRPCLQNHLIAIQMAKQWGCRIIVDHDDDLLNMPIGSPDFEYFRQCKPFVAACIALADQVWVSTPTLAALYAHRNTVVIPNAVLPDDLPQEWAKNSGTIVWRGSAAHREDLEAGKVNYPAILRAGSRMLFLGYAPTWATVEGKKVDYEPPLNIMEYLNWLMAQKPMAIWKPLARNKFNDGKSNISWLEATCAGAVCISNYKDSPGWEHVMREPSKYPDDYPALVNKSIKVIKKDYNLLSWNDIRYREILRIASGS